MNSKAKFILGILTASGYVGPYVCGSEEGGALRDAELVEFPVTVGVWSIFVLLFVKLK